MSNICPRFHIQTLYIQSIYRSTCCFWYLVWLLSPSLSLYLCTFRSVLHLLINGRPHQGDDRVCVPGLYRGWRRYLSIYLSMSVCLSSCLSICLPVYLTICICDTIQPSMYMFIHLLNYVNLWQYLFYYHPTCMPVCLAIYLFIYQSIYTCIRRFIYLCTAYLSDYLLLIIFSICLSIYPSIYFYRSVCLIYLPFSISLLSIWWLIFHWSSLVFQ